MLTPCLAHSRPSFSQCQHLVFWSSSLSESQSSIPGHLPFLRVTLFNSLAPKTPYKLMTVESLFPGQTSLHSLKCSSLLNFTGTFNSWSSSHPQMCSIFHVSHSGEASPSFLQSDEVIPADCTLSLPPSSHALLCCPSAPARPTLGGKFSG